MRILISIITWVVEKAFELAVFSIWLAFYLAIVIFNLIARAAAGKDVTRPILVWNHLKAVAPLLSPEEFHSLEYCGRGGWEHRLYRYYLSQVVYIYLTDQRILVVSKNRGNHEFSLGTVQLQTDEAIGRLDLIDQAHSIYLGYVSGDGINQLTRRINTYREKHRSADNPLSSTHPVQLEPTDLRKESAEPFTRTPTCDDSHAIEGTGVRPQGATGTDKREIVTSGVQAALYTAQNSSTPDPAKDRLPLASPDPSATRTASAAMLVAIISSAIALASLTALVFFIARNNIGSPQPSTEPIGTYPPTSTIATDVGSPNTQAPSVTGDWKGTYTCAQGSTNLDLEISNDRSGQVEAVFSFSTDQDSKYYITGSFDMIGVQNGSHVTLTGTQWINNPTNDVMVNLDGYLTADAQGFNGSVASQDGHSGCTAFSLQK
jgi:hypothetical protein